MTIPTRPAPAPPQMRNFNSNNGSAAAADANATLEQLRLQIQQQQQQKITIKLPPPPKGGGMSSSKIQHNNISTATFPQQKNNYNNNINNNFDFDSGSSSITRKFPKARYAPTTNWDDSPFEAFEAASTMKTTITTAKTTTTAITSNGNFSKKKVPPPRPPPPKVLVNGARTKIGQNGHTPQSCSSSNILTNIFHRKKVTTTTTSTSTSTSATNKKKLAKENMAARVYGLSSGNYASTAQTSATKSSTSSSSSSAYEAGFANTDWNAAWNTTATNTNNGGSSSNNNYFSTTTTTTTTKTQDDQLISFDSPPSSPTFTQKSNSDCVSVDSFSSDSNFSSPQNGSVSQPESGFEDDFSGTGSQSRSRPATTSPMDPWETFDAFGSNGVGVGVGVGAANAAGYGFSLSENIYCSTATIGTAPVRNLNALNMRTTANTNTLNAYAASQDNPLCNGKSLLPPTPTVNMPTIIKPKISQKPKAPKPPVFSLIKQPQHQQQNADDLNSDLNTPPSPPMPQCAPPPPPPSILDVISGKVDALQLAAATTAYGMESSANDDPPYGIALYDFEGAEEGDLCFREGEKIYLIEQASDEWYRGRTRAGCEGLLPANYIDVKVPLQTTTTTAPIKTQNVLPKVRCLYDFVAEVEGDLALKENDMVTILYRINEDWLFGEMNNRQGQFPANFLEYLPTNIPLP